MKSGLLVAISLFFAAILITAQDEMTPALAELADAERAFAKTATQKGIRDAFLEFFADDAVALEPEPASWKDRLRARPAVPFSEHELLWEPRSGDVAASGELGWLTGPSTFTNKKDSKQPVHGNYLSVWRKQADGSWKVFLDVGTDAPGPVEFPEGFKRYEFGPRYNGKEGKSASTASLLDRDRSLNARLAKEPAAVVYAQFLARNARVHRQWSRPTVGRDNAQQWFVANPSAITAVTGAAEAARSGDFGYSYGTFTTKESPRKGSYIRLWSRTMEGQWLIVVDVLTPPAPKPGPTH